MKTTKNKMYGMLIALTLLLAGSSCSNDDERDPGNADSGTIKAKVDGATFTSNPQFSAANRISVGSTTTVTLQGNDSSGKGIVIVLNGVTGPGIYQIGGGANISISASYIEVNTSNPQATQTWQAPFDSSVAGEVTIDEFTETKITGSFEFTCKNSGNNSTKQITEGAFNL
ncbi:DUF6252 family protein [Algoriphagus sp. AGSA1]|uniref:DUF6252 family protein n=1 Tax=Algoriphagus sp. AGSA1 TaxID=2907213 RepID=UPI001F3D15AF|nr:DUF6252 family protein [Algoriphagus sp. AGSA1]MCE7054164.1 DUF6252 family protein [Algoriphagus sp. AGSA1]